MPYVSRDVISGIPGAARGGHVDMLLHMGDFAYDFDSAGGAVGRAFMQDIANYSTKVRP